MKISVRLNKTMFPDLKFNFKLKDVFNGDFSVNTLYTTLKNTLDKFLMQKVNGISVTSVELYLSAAPSKTAERKQTRYTIANVKYDYHNHRVVYQYNNHRIKQAILNEIMSWNFKANHNLIEARYTPVDTPD